MSWDRIFRPRKYQHDDGVRRDPLSIGVAFLVNIGYSGAISGLGATLLGAAILGAAAIGLQFLANAIFTQTPKATDRQATLRQALGPRVRFYGRNKLGGTLWFFESRDGKLYTAITLNEGEISEIHEVWLNDKQVDLDSEGRVTTDPYPRPGGGSYVIIRFKMGTAGQFAESLLTAAFPEVTSAHRLRGVAYVTAVFEEVAKDEISTVYPTGNPNVRVVADCSLVKSVRTGAQIYSDNNSDCIYDYLTARDGAGFPYGSGYLESQIDLASFQAFADVCDEPVPLKAGGTTKRYLLWGGFALTEQQREVLPRMLASCAAELYLTNEGKIGIRGGKWIEPELVLDDTLGHIISGEFRQGQKSLAAFNELTINYVEPALDYSEAEAERWLDTENIDLRGKVLPARADFAMAPNHSQARRLGKIYSGRQNPKWAGKIITNFYGMNAVNESVVRIKFSPLGIDEVFAINRVRVMDNMMNVELEVSSISPEIYEWDAATEEGTAPSIPPDTSTGTAPPPPDNIVIEAATADGATVFNISWDPPSRAALTQEVQYRRTGDASWLNAYVVQDQDVAQTGPVISGGYYDFQIRTLAPAGNPGAWESFNAVQADPPPQPLTNVVVSGGLGRATLTYRSPASVNVSEVKAYRAPTGVPLNKVTHLLATYEAVPSTNYTKVDGDATRTNIIVDGVFNTAIGAGTWTGGAGWNIAGGKAVGTASGAGANLLQTLAAAAAAVIRFDFTVSNFSAGTVANRLQGGTANVTGTGRTANGRYLEALTVSSPSANTSIGLNKNAAFVGDVDSMQAFVETPTSAPQGVWDYYLEPVSDTGVVGALSGPYTRTVV